MNNPLKNGKKIKSLKDIWPGLPTTGSGIFSSILKNFGIDLGKDESPQKALSEFLEHYGSADKDLEMIGQRPSAYIGKQYGQLAGIHISLELMQYTINMALRKTDSATAYNMFIEGAIERINTRNQEITEASEKIDADESLDDKEKEARKAENEKNRILLTEDELPSHVMIKKLCAPSLYTLRNADFDRLWEKDEPLNGAALKPLVSFCLKQPPYTSLKDMLPKRKKDEEDLENDENFAFTNTQSKFLVALVAKAVLHLAYNEALKQDQELRQKMADEVVSTLKLAFSHDYSSDESELATVRDFQIPEAAASYFFPLFDAAKAAVEDMNLNLDQDAGTNSDGRGSGDQDPLPPEDLIA